MLDPVPDTSVAPRSADFATTSHGLVLVPTLAELNGIRQSLGNPSGIVFELCGFGPIAAAARTASLLAQHRPSRVYLVGIAGAVGTQLSVGQASAFDRVSCYGVGAGSGIRHQSAAELGWNQWSPEAGDSIVIGPPSQPSRHLVSVCSASADAADVQAYRGRFPDALAEDMEGFGVAMACHLNRVGLSIIRGISNVAGDRDKSRWRIAAALNAAGELLRQVIDLDRSNQGTHCG
ncbi:Futalosine hydrolase [Rosistilla carotiformis]|uniref:Futalosine hydrolase n=1 Tax=Rosistilla carotiformis TaxID=2528017 RepID=A0A518JQT3_9BACT|nr:futalosine hydrolase [Rosistilla carotiformis]QDV67896.1 Futalosine hydrolase [Rosistilla carotiformis]